MDRRILGLALALMTAVLVGCQPPREFPPGVTDIDLWEPYDIRPDTEVPDQYPHGRSGLAGPDIDDAAHDDAGHDDAAHDDEGHEVEESGH